MSAIDTAEFRKLTLLAAGIDPTEIPPILDTAEWRRLLIVAIEQATAGGGGGGAVSSVNSKTGAVVLNAADVGAIGGTTGAIDNSILRANGTGGATLQNSGLVIEDAIQSFAVTGVASTDIITATGSAFANGQPVRFSALTGGAGLVTTTNYFVINVSGATFQVSTSVGGAASLFATDITTGTLLTGHSVSTNVTISENTTATNSDLVLTPKGNGALIVGPKPDGTATGGNARGIYAIDLQTIRLAATQVAAGQDSVICGGRHNSCSGIQAFVGGGFSSNANGIGCVVVGGEGNAIATSGANSDYSVICGGSGNSVLFGGRGAFIGGGRVNTASGNCAVVVGGGERTSINGNSASASASGVLSGLRGLADRFAMQAHSSGAFAELGDAQRSRFVLRCKTTSSTPVEMALDGATTYLGIPNGKVMAMTINIAGISSLGAVAHYIRQYAVRNNILGLSTQIYSPVTIGSDNPSGTSIALSVNDPDDTMRILVTGTSGVIWRWVATVDAVEIGYGT